MTGIFDFIRRQITLAENNEELKNMLVEVLTYASSRLYNCGNELEWWYYQEYDGARIKAKDFDLKDWDNYFSFLHDKDHETDHRVFAYPVVKLILQFEDLTKLDFFARKSQLMTLFKYTTYSRKYFDKHFLKCHSVWVRRGSIFQRKGC